MVRRMMLGMVGAVMVAVVSAGVCGGVAPGVIAGARLERGLENARALMESGRWDGAEEAWRIVLRDEPDHPEAVGGIRALHEDESVRVETDEAGLDGLAALLGNGFYQIETPWFVVLSDCDEVWTAARAGVLERTARQYRRAMDTLGLSWVPPESKMVCVLFREHGDFVAFAGEHDGVEAVWVSGYYATASNRVAFYDESSSPSVRRAIERLEEAEESSRLDPGESIGSARADLERHAREASIAKTVHEAVHMLAFNCGLQRRSREYPFWFTEGLAGSFETAEPRHAFGPTVEQPDVRERLRSLDEGGKLMPMSKLIRVLDARDVSSEEASVMYAQANSLFRYLYRFEREGLARYARALWANGSRRTDAEAHAAIFREHLGDPQKIERRWVERFVRD